MAENTATTTTSKPTAEKIPFQWYKSEEEAQAGRHNAKDRLFTVKSPSGPTLYAWGNPVAGGAIIAKYATEYCGVVLDWEGKGSKTITSTDAENFLRTLPADQLSALMARVAPEQKKGKGK
jgi:hypothetical protein